MATTISRTWYNTLQDDSGSGTDGTVIDKADFNEILNAIDAMFAGAIVTGGSLTIAGALAGATTGTFSGAVSMTALTATRGTMSTGTITTSQPVMTGTQTWDAVAVTFTGISLNVTDTASAAASLLLDLQVGGASKFKVQKDGAATIGDLATYALIGAGANGLGIAATHASGAVRIYAGGTTEVARITANGQFKVGTTSDLAGTPAGLTSYTNQNTTYGMSIGTAADVAGGSFARFFNASGAPQGSITATNSTTTAYNTSSDQRLKDDLGLASDLSGLRALRVHDFAWKENGQKDRGVFAQEAYAVMPRGITPGGGGDDMGQIWMAEKAAYVPDLIVGWQQHEARIAALEAKLGVG